MALVAAAWCSEYHSVVPVPVFTRVVVGDDFDLLQRILIGQHGGLVTGRPLDAHAVQDDVVGKSRAAIDPDGGSLAAAVNPDPERSRVLGVAEQAARDDAGLQRGV